MKHKPSELPFALMLAGLLDCRLCSDTFLLYLIAFKTSSSWFIFVFSDNLDNVTVLACQSSSASAARSLGSRFIDFNRRTQSSEGILFKKNPLKSKPGTKFSGIIANMLLIKVDGLQSPVKGRLINPSKRW